MKPLATAPLIFLLATPIHAQDDPPWPPDPAEIFAPGIEIISTAQLELPPFPVEGTPTPPPPNRCGGEVPHVWQAWVFDSVDDPTHLCNTLTGELSPALPDGYRWDVMAGGNNGAVGVATSPDGKWIVFLGRREGEKSLAVLVYDVNAETYQVIGTITRQQFLLFGQWVTNEVVLVSTYDTGAHSVYSHYLYAVDLRYRTISKHGIDHDDAVTYYPDPPRLITRTGSSSDLHCTETIYFIDTRQLVQHDYGPFCEVEYRNMTTGATYFRVLTPGGGADVVRYDRETGEQVTIFHGAVEHIAWVSADERFAALMLGENSGYGVAVPPMSGSRSPDYFFAHLALVKLATGEELYRTGATWNGWAGYWSPRFGLYAEDYFWISTLMGGDGPNKLLRWDGKGVVEEIPVDGNLAPPLGVGWALMTPPILSEVDRKVDLYHIHSGQIVRLVEVPDAYAVEVEHLHDNVFRVTVAPLPYADRRRTIFGVRVPGVEIPESD